MVLALVCVTGGRGAIAGDPGPATGYAPVHMPIITDR